METGNTSVLDANQIITPKWKIVKPVMDDLEEETGSDSIQVTDQIKINGDNKPVVEFNPVTNFLQSQVYAVNIPKKWKLEGILPPTILCKEKSANIIKKLYKDKKIIPVRVNATIEEGLFIKYVDYNTSKELSIEIYNDFDIAALITQNNEIIKTVDIIDENFEEIITIFQTR